MIPLVWTFPAIPRGRYVSCVQGLQVQGLQARLVPIGACFTWEGRAREEARDRATAREAAEMPAR